MSLLLIQTPAGENALVVNDHLIISGESTDDSHNLVTKMCIRDRINSMAAGETTVRSTPASG